MEFPHYINLIFDTFYNNNFEAYLVGGCVRDFLLDKEVYDFDFTTNATPEEVKKLFKDYKLLLHGEKYGTVVILFDNVTIEITTFRKEISYNDNRHPKVVFTDSLEEDLSRRDFTINTICMDKMGKIVDLFDGKKDLEKSTIRAVGEPDLRFEEDALRILRAVRFASVLGFEIEEQTHIAMQKSLDFLDNISGERKYDEFIKTLLGKDIKRVFCDYSDIFGKICPEIPKMKGFLQNNPYHLYDILEHSSIVIDETPKDVETRLSAFFHDTGKVHSYSYKNGCGHFYGHGQISVGIAERDLTRLKVSKKILKNVLTLIKYHDYTVYPEKADVKRWLRKLGEVQLKKLLDLQLADTLAKSEKAFYKLDMITSARRIMNEILAKNETYLIEHLAINGNDLLKIGVQDKKIGEVLEFLLESIIEEKVKNQKEELLNLVYSFDNLSE